jgi:protein SCO1
MLRRFAFLLVLPLLGCPSPPTASPPTGAVRATDLNFPVPEFKLTERSGKTVTRDDLKGKVWIASFVFVRCSGPCPQVSATMARLQKELKLTETPDLRLVTFTIDPDRDTPSELKDYAKTLSADPDRWLFLTGKEEEIHNLLIQGFKAAVVRTKSTTVGEEFDHSTRLAVVDKAGVIQAYFDGLKSKQDTPEDFEDNLRKLKAKVAERLKE